MEGENLDHPFEKITNTPVDELFDSEIELTGHYKHFITSCLQIDYEKRATPEYIINYEWPLAQDYVDGVEPENGGYKPLSMIKIPVSNGLKRHLNPSELQTPLRKREFEEMSLKYITRSHSPSLTQEINLQQQTRIQAVSCLR
uniref:Protein kinase domain-containing protein n=1 Tax=Nymphaea colorata TaxID=210225 RepID=A0A5K1HE42_9MAGN|nr:unnamed protein product [Nymphaea colorata]